MIAYIEGRLAQFTVNSAVIITASGVGYELFLPAHTLCRLPAPGEQARFYTSLTVREDAQELFGFETWDERQTFLKLTSLTKVGAKTALAILSVFRPDDLRRIVAENDPDALTRASGIGKKTALRIFLELKDKIETAELPYAIPETKQGGIFRDVLSGLEGLGYNEAEAAPVLRKLLQDEPDLDVSSALRAVLRAMARVRQGETS